VLTVIKPYL